MNLPNSITFARLILTAIFVLGVSLESTLGLVIALTAFILAAISDWLDGYLARKMDLVTSLGKLMDPLADKILVSSAFIYFTSVERCPVWVTAVIIGREFLVTGLRQIAVDKGEVIPADHLGKWKTTFQLSFSITCLLSLIFYSNPPRSALGNFLMNVSAQDGWLSPIFLWGALILTLLSGFNYLKKSWKILLD